VTGLLASVASAAEAEIALDAGADIIDLKDPRTGALGALAAPAVRAAVARVAGRRTVSATAGDLPMRPRLLRDAVARIADLGVDIVKVGLFPGGDRDACLDALAREAARGLRLVLVMFADRDPDFAVIDRLRGFAGAMLDTADKTGSGLRGRLDDATLGRFVARARAAGLLGGLAGSLSAADVAPLARLGPDYLGFRGALCAGGRNSPLDPARLRAMRALVARHSAAASAATAAAGAQRAAHSRLPARLFRRRGVDGTEAPS